MTLSIQEIVDGFKNKRGETYRRLVCLRDARSNICFEKKGLYHPELPQPQEFEFNKIQHVALNAIERMAAILTFGPDAGCAPSPCQELRDHLMKYKHKNEALKKTDRYFGPEATVVWMNEAIELLDKID